MKKKVEKKKMTGRDGKKRRRIKKEDELQSFKKRDGPRGCFQDEEKSLFFHSAS